MGGHDFGDGREMDGHDFGDGPTQVEWADTILDADLIRNVEITTS